MATKADGYITIGTKLETKQFQKDLANQKRQLDKYVKEQDRLSSKKTKAELDLSGYEQEKKLIQESTNEWLKQAQTQKEVDSLIATEEAQIEELNVKYSKQLNTLNEINKKIQANAESQNAVKTQMKETSIAMNKMGKDINVNYDKIGKSMSGIIKKVARWGLALIGIRSVYSGIRSAMSTLSQYNDQLSVDLQYIQYALAKTLEPVIQRIIQLIYKLMYYVNYLAKAWFNIDLFANASAKGFSSATKNAQKLTKTLAGFDEANVLSDSTSDSGAGTGVSTPSFDLSGMENVEIPSWLKWIRDNGELVGKILLVIAFGLTAVGLGFSFLVGLGIGLILVGIITLIKGIVEFIKDPSWDNFLTILEGIALIVAGIAILFGGWLVALIALGVAIVAYIIKNWDKVKEILGIVGTWIYDHIIEPVVGFFVGLWTKIIEIFSPVIEFFKSVFGTVFENIKIIIGNIKQIFSLLWQGIKIIFEPVVNFFKDVFKKAYNGIKEIFSPIVNFFSELWTKVKGKLKDFGTKAGEIMSGAFKGVINAVLTTIENVLNNPIKAINKLINVINKVPGINLTKLTTFSLPRLAVGGIVNMPSRGVPVGNAIAGESGKEGVLPLTNQNTMAELGREIGKWVSINNVIDVNMDSRRINRILANSKNSDLYSRNGVA